MAIAARRAGNSGLFWILAGALVLAFVLHLSFGGTWLQPTDVLRELAHGNHSDTNQNLVVWQLRLPRAIACLLVGSILAVVGASFQSLFRNPLADPYTTSVSSGAAAGGVLAILLKLSIPFGTFGMMIFAAIGGLLSLALVLALARRHGVTAVSTLLLAGVVVGSLLSGLTTLLLYLAGEDTNKVLKWLLGSMTPMFWMTVLILAVVALVGSTLLILQSRRLNAFAIAESTAQQLGIDIAKLRTTVLVAGAVMVSACVGAVGMIGFVGLVSPHIARRLLGVDWRASMPGALLVGASLLLISDMLAQRVISATEVPVGVVTALLGAPFLIVLLRKADT